MTNKTPKRTKFFTRDSFTIYEAAMLWIGEEPCDDYSPAEKILKLKSFEYYEVAREILRAIKDGEIPPDAVDPEEALRPGDEVEREDIYGRTRRPLNYEKTDYYKYTDILPTQKDRHIDTEIIEFGIVMKRIPKWDAIRNYDLSVYQTMINRDALAIWADSRNECPDFLERNIQEPDGDRNNLIPQESHNTKSDNISKTNSFKRENKIWRITFEGKTISLPDIKGVNFLRFLMENKGKLISTLDLEMRFSDHGKSRTLECVIKSVDDETKDECKEQLKRIERKLDAADSDSTEEKILKLKEEKEKLENYLKSCLGLGGRIRTLKNYKDRSRTAVTNNIERAFRHMMEEHLSLWQHFKIYYRMAEKHCVYNPPESITWEL